MGYSKVELANQALDHLGKDRIASLTENSTAARKIVEVFDRSIHSVLSRSHWSFARKFLTLASLTNDWDERWGYKYDLPSDCATFIRIVPLHDPDGRDGPPHQMHGGAIYTNERDAKGEYVYKTVNTLAFPQPFLDTCSFFLAREIALPLTRKRSNWVDMNNMFTYQLGLAVEHDSGQEPTYLPEGDNGYIDARGGPAKDTSGAAPDGSIYWE